jgi:hypothetical protein
MSEVLPEIYLVRHGNTAWTLTGQHTGLIDLPLTRNGKGNARRLGERLKGMTFVKVFTRPLQRVARTCELAGFGPWPKPILTWRNGITVNTRGCAWPKSFENARIGNCSGTVAREANHPHKLASGRTVWSSVVAWFRATSYSFPAGISFGFWQPAGWRSVRDLRAGILY